MNHLRFLLVAAVAITTLRAAADKPVPRTDPNSKLAHEQLLAKAKQGRIDVYFVGDSITRRWGATDYPDFLEHWKKSFRKTLVSVRKRTLLPLI